MDGLLKGLERFGWNQDGIPSQQDIEEWVDRAGKLVPGVRGSWLNLGFIRESGTNDATLSQAHPNALPPLRMKRVGGRLISITSSLSCVVMVFVLNNDYAKKLDSALRRDRQTFSKSTSRFRTFSEPETQKIDDIRQIRDETKRIVTSWFSLNLPGLFSSGLLEGEMPTCEFVTLRDAEPFPRMEHAAPYFLRSLGLDFPDGVWASTDIPGLKLSLRDWVGSSPQYHSILSMKESALSDERLKNAWGWSGRDARILFIDDFLKEGWLLHISALLLMLEGYGNHLRDIRDSAILRRGSRQNSVTTLDKLASNVSFSIDIDAVTSELQSFTEPESRKRLRLPTFEPIESQLYPEGYTLAESLCSAIAKRASWIQKMDRSLRDHGTQYGALVGAMENVRLQKQIKYFTIALTALTIVLLLETPGVQNFLKELYRWLQSLWVNFTALNFL